MPMVGGSLGALFGSKTWDELNRRFAQQTQMAQQQFNSLNEQFLGYGYGAQKDLIVQEAAAKFIAMKKPTNLEWLDSKINEVRMKLN